MRAAPFGCHYRLVLVTIDRPADMILLPVDLLPFRIRQATVVIFPICSDLTIDPGFTAFELCRLSRIQTAGFNSLRDAILLILFPASYFTIAEVIRRGVVLVRVDLLAERILLTINLLLLCLSQRSAVGFAVRANLPVQRAFLVFQARSFARSELT